MNVEIQSYRRDAATVPIEQAITRLGELQDSERTNLCRELGLDKQRAYSGATPQQAAAVYPELEAYELTIWTHFLPTYYSQNDGMWERYSFDIIPVGVLQAVRIAGSLGVFDDIEIWTPQNFDRDPMAVGVVGRRPVNQNHWATNSGSTGNTGSARFFQIVRWDESLQPFEVIERTVRGRCIGKSPVGFAGLGEGAKAALYAMTRDGNGLRSVSFNLASIFKRHCGKNCLQVNHRYTICQVCGTATGKQK